MNSWDKMSPVAKTVCWYGLAAITWALHTGLLKLLGVWDVTWDVVLVGLWVPLLGAVCVAWAVVLYMPLLALNRWWDHRRHQRRARPLVAAPENVCKHDQEFRVTGRLDQVVDCNATLFCGKCGLQLRHCVTHRSYDARTSDPFAHDPYHWGLALEELKGHHPLADVAICGQIDALYQARKKEEEKDV